MRSLRLLLNMLLPVAITAVIVSLLSAQNQEFDLLIRNGHVIDPRNGINAVMDVAINGGKIALVASNIAAARARQIADATGAYVTPGLIDIHAHVRTGSGATTRSHSTATATAPFNPTTTRSAPDKPRWSTWAAPDGEASRSSKSRSSTAPRRACCPSSTSSGPA